MPNTKIELLEPLGEDSPIAKFLERNPDGGIHHVCYEVDDILAARDQLRQQGARVLGDGEPKIGAHGKPVLFLHPKDFSARWSSSSRPDVATWPQTAVAHLLPDLVDRAVRRAALGRPQPAEERRDGRRAPIPALRAIPQLGPKLLWTTVVAALIFAACYAVYVNHLVTLRAWWRRSARGERRGHRPARVIPEPSEPQISPFGTC